MPTTAPNRSEFTALCRRVFLGAMPLLVLSPSLFAQTTPSPAVTAAILARYDRNKNGILDAGELTARDADERRAMGAVPAASAADMRNTDVVQLTPFEVSSETERGYTRRHPAELAPRGPRRLDLGGHETTARGHGRTRYQSTRSKSRAARTRASPA